MILSYGYVSVIKLSYTSINVMQGYFGVKETLSSPLENKMYNIVKRTSLKVLKHFNKKNKIDVT